MGDTFARDVTEIAFALIGVTLVALLVSHSSGASQVITSTAGAFGGLLKTVSLQSQYGASPSANAPTFG